MNVSILAERFQCPKCHGKKPLLEEQAIPRSGKLPLPILDKYLFITCSLCGYTEIYNMKIMEHAEAPVHQPVSGEVKTSS